MSTQPKIPATDEAWEDGKLGTDAEFAIEADGDIEAEIDEALELKLISIRLQKSLIDDFKYIAAVNNIGYQTLMRQILQRFADSEKKRILRDLADEVIKAREAERKAKATSNSIPPPMPQQKVA